MAREIRWPGSISRPQDQNNGLYQSDALTDTNGYYVLAVLGGLGSSDPWSPGYSGNQSPIFSRHPLRCQNGGTNINSGQAVPPDFTGLLATNYITGNVQFNGTNVIGAGVSAYATINGLGFNLNTVDTDANGNYSLPVANGDWSVSVNCQGGSDSLDNLLGSGNYTCPNNDTVSINNSSGVANFSVAKCGGVQHRGDDYRCRRVRSATIMITFSRAPPVTATRFGR